MHYGACEEEEKEEEKALILGFVNFLAHFSLKSAREPDDKHGMTGSSKTFAFVLAVLLPALLESSSFARPLRTHGDRVRESLEDSSSCTSLYVNENQFLNSMEQQCVDQIKVSKTHIPKKGIYYAHWQEYTHGSDANLSDPVGKARDTMFDELNRESNYKLPPDVAAAGATPGAKKFPWVEKVVVLDVAEPQLLRLTESSDTTSSVLVMPDCAAKIAPAKVRQCTVENIEKAKQLYIDLTEQKEFCKDPQNKKDKECRKFLGTLGLLRGLNKTTQVMRSPNGCIRLKKIEHFTIVVQAARSSRAPISAPISAPPSATPDEDDVLARNICPECGRIAAALAAAEERFPELKWTPTMTPKEHVQALQDAIRRGATIDEIRAVAPYISSDDSYEDARVRLMESVKFQPAEMRTLLEVRYPSKAKMEEWYRPYIPQAPVPAPVPSSTDEIGPAPPDAMPGYSDDGGYGEMPNYANPY